MVLRRPVSVMPLRGKYGYGWMIVAWVALIGMMLLAVAAALSVGAEIARLVG